MTKNTLLLTAGIAEARSKAAEEALRNMHSPFGEHRHVYAPRKSDQRTFYRCFNRTKRAKIMIKRRRLEAGK